MPEPPVAARAGHEFLGWGIAAGMLLALVAGLLLVGAAALVRRRHRA